MLGYSHLLDEERDHIAALKAAGRSLGAIAKAVGRGNYPEFRVWAGMMGGKEPPHAKTQRTSYP